MKKELSLQNWLRHYWFGAAAVLAVIALCSQILMLAALTRTAEQTIRKNVHIVQEDIESSLDGVDSFLYESLYRGTQMAVPHSFFILANAQPGEELFNARWEVQSSIQSVVSWSDTIDAVVVCTPREDGNAFLEAGETESYLLRRELKSALGPEILSGERPIQRYMIYDRDSQRHMLRLMRVGESVIIISVSSQRLLRTLQYAQLTGEGAAFLAQEDGALIASTEEDLEGPFTVEDEGRYVNRGGRTYLQTGYLSERTGCYFGILTPLKSLAGNMMPYYALTLVLMASLLTAMPFLSRLLKRRVGAPVNEIAKTMERVAEEGDLDITVETSSNILELGTLSRSFNNMISQIKKLKIEKYESELQVQKATMQYLQLQIKPHFYANMFNIIYSLAQRRDYEAIQRVSTAVVDYSRYMFRDASEMVELWRELDHVRNYLEIQRIRSQNVIECVVDSPEELRDALVPPFVIEGFVENSVKYGSTADRPFTVRITVRPLTESDQLELEIRDSGPGYSRQVLESDWRHEELEGGHIGLMNIWNRLKIVYDDKADMEIRNDNGAVTTIRIPRISFTDTDIDID